MATDTFTTSLRVRQIAPGTETDTWGASLNTQIGLLDVAIAGVTSVDATLGPTLTTNNGTSDQARSAILVVTGTPVSTEITIPSVPKRYTIRPKLTSGHFRITTGSGETTEWFNTSTIKGIEEIYTEGGSVFTVPKNNIGDFKFQLNTTLRRGWAICDGGTYNGFKTPNMNEQFIRIATSSSPVVGQDVSAGNSFGDDTVIVPIAAHDHGGATQSHTLTISQIPPHTHTYTNKSNDGGAGSGVAGSNLSANTGSTGGGQGHTHGLTTEAGYNVTVSTTPAHVYMVPTIFVGHAGFGS